MAKDTTSDVGDQPRPRSWLAWFGIGALVVIGALVLVLTLVLPDQEQPAAQQASA